MKVKNNMPSKAKIRLFNEFLKCFVNWFISQDRDFQIDFCKKIKFDPDLLDDIK